MKILMDKRDRELFTTKLRINSKGYVVCQEKLLHRVIMNAKEGEVVDHINGNKLDNRRKNLRICTNSENVRFQKRHKNNTSGFKGVSWSKGMKKWEARIMVDRKSIVGGYFSNRLDAAKEYNRLATKFFGEYAMINNL